MREINIYEVLDKISDALIECDSEIIETIYNALFDGKISYSEIIETIYNALFDGKISYIGDSVFVEIGSN